jgi:SAM-dependent methyltransferase
MLRAASRVLHRGEVRFPRRRVGVVYDRRSFAVELPGAERVDFWACDAQALPFADGTFAAAASLNLIDCVASPADAVASLAGVLAPGGKALVATPYDWSPGATQVEAWLGGHSQRGEEGGASEPALRRLLSSGGVDPRGGLRIVAEEPALPWRVRLHERSAVDYRVHLVAVEKETEEGGE